MQGIHTQFNSTPNLSMLIKVNSPNITLKLPHVISKLFYYKKNPTHIHLEANFIYRALQTPMLKHQSGWA